VIVADLTKTCSDLLRSNAGEALLSALLGQPGAADRVREIAVIVVLEAKASDAERARSPRDLVNHERRVSSDQERVKALVQELRDLLVPAHHGPLDEIDRQMRHGPYGLRSWASGFAFNRLPSHLVAKRGGGGARSLRRGVLGRQINELLPVPLAANVRNTVIAGLLSAAGYADTIPQHIPNIIKPAE
jgi:hypothetical protein